MVKGLHTVGLGVLPKTMKLDVIANNLANVNTTGYKKSNLFVRELINADQVATNSNSGDQNTQVAQSFSIDFSQGRLDQTKNPLDLAINGEGFFAVETDNGTKYTRNGHFTISNDGTLVTSDGYKVLGEGGEIHIVDPQKISADDIEVTKNGEILIGKKIIAKLQVVSFPENESGQTVLKYAGDNLYSAPDNYSFGSVEIDKFDIQQGFLEGSNVNALDEMVQMMKLNSSIQIDQKVIRSQDTSLQQANEIGKI
jgi:flagellar basal-body rod protein FlgF